MKKVSETDEIKPVDFAGGIRGKHSASYRRGHTVKIRQEDGTILVQKFVPDTDAVVIDPDVRAYFSDAAMINYALRALIKIMPHKQRKMRSAN